jgi:hypothetical protein
MQLRPSPCPHLNVRDVPDDFKHWIDYRGRRISAVALSLQMAVQANFDFRRSPRGVGHGLGSVRAFQVGILAENLIARGSCGNQADECADGDAQAPGAHRDGVKLYERAANIAPTQLSVPQSPQASAG